MMQIQFLDPQSESRFPPVDIVIVFDEYIFFFIFILFFKLPTQNRRLATDDTLPVDRH